MFHDNQIGKYLRLGTHPNPPIYSRHAIITSPSHPSAINDQDMAVNVIARRGTKKYCRTRKALRITPAAGGDALENLAAANGVAAERSGVVRCHITRSNCIHVDPFGRPFVRECFRELGDAALGRGVGGHKDTALKRKNRGNVYDFPGLPLPEHLLTSKLRETKDSRKVDGNHLVPIFGREFRRGRAPNRTGVIHDDVDRTEFTTRFLHYSPTAFTTPS